MTRVEDLSDQSVAAKRAAGAGWGAIARMFGVSEPALRRRFDGGWLPPARQTQAVSPREEVRLGLIRAAFSPDEAMILARMWQANCALVTTADLARGVIGSSAATYLVRDVRQAAARRGVTFIATQGQGFALTHDGKVRIEILAGLRDIDGGPL